jgi:hypothetical protein
MELTKEEMIKICKVYENRFGENNWCLTKYAGDSLSTKLIVRDRGGYTPTINVSDEVLVAVNSHYGIDNVEHDIILLSTMQD